ncbi:MAG: IS3 family transposase [Amaricoccus sp.]
MIAFIDDHRAVHGVEPICRELAIAPSTYHAHAARRAEPSKASVRARGATASRPCPAGLENFRVYSVRKVWRQLGREDRRLRAMHGCPPDAPDGAAVVRGKSVRTTISDKAAPCPLDQVNRAFRVPAPGWLWVSDFTYVATWAGFAYVAFVIDATPGASSAGRVSPNYKQALSSMPWNRRCTRASRERGAGLVYSDRGVQYLSIRYAERLAEAGIVPSVGSVGDSYDNALAETVIGLFKAEVIHRRGPWRSREDVEIAALEWVDWFNTRRLLDPIWPHPTRRSRRPLLRRAGHPPCRRVGLKPTCLRETRRGSPV